MSDPGSMEHPSWLTSGDFTEADEPFQLFAAWFKEAAGAEPADPNAMALATTGDEGLPNLRMVLLKNFDGRGFVFYTNDESQKGRELAAAPQAAALFHWKSLTRQVRVRGPVERVSGAEADAYFESRPRLSQIGAWASRQSAPLEDRFALEKAVARFTAKFAVGSIPRPPHWGGYRIVPLVLEFWHDRPFRLHQRVEFRRESMTSPWVKTRLYP
jgi:pyridoxamine 5'-phosphate oxidase